MCETNEGLKVKINTQDNKINNLDARINKLEEKIDALTKTINDFIMELRTNYLSKEEFKETKEIVHQKIDKLNTRIENIELKQSKYELVKMIVFGAVGIILGGVLNSIMNLL